jgi:tetratricopeptide (TPR) repeat protein
MRERVERRRKRKEKIRSMRLWVNVIITLLGLVIVCSVLYQFPLVHNLIAPRVEQWQAAIFYQLNPPEEAIFLPDIDEQSQIAAIVDATLRAETQVSNPQVVASVTLDPLQPTPMSTPSPTVTLSPTPLPPQVILSGVRYMDQHSVWNYCAPANLAMGLSFWDWDGNRYDTGAYLRGYLARKDDKNVMPYEMEAYVEEETDLQMVIRYGGTLNLLKSLMANGFVVLIEKGYDLEDVGWLGHFLTLTGYDEGSQKFLTQDSYHGPDIWVDYNEVYQTWRPFNFIFLVIYPPHREAEVLQILGPWADIDWANRHALERAYADVEFLSGRDLYFAWYNVGTSHVELLEYADATFAYDFSFTLYAGLAEKERPWRMVWYQTGPYKAYYYTGRYSDVEQLASTTLEAMKEPILEESYYWRGLAREMMGDREGAIEDLRTSVDLNPNFLPGWTQLERLGVPQS